MASLHQLRDCDEQGPGRELAGRPGNGDGRISFRIGTWRNHGGCKAGQGGSVARCRGNVDADADSHDADREGVYFTHDLGKTWLWIERMPFRDVDDLYYDAHMDKVLVSSRSSDQVYAIDPKTLKWKYAQTGYSVGLIRGAGDKMIAASMFDGVLLEP